MKTVIAHLKSTQGSPISFSRYHDTPKLERELADAYERRTWRNRLHVDEDGMVFIPGIMLKNSLAEAAKYLSMQVPGKGKATFTKHFEAGVLCVDPIPLDIHKDDVMGEPLMLNADGRRGSGKRVMRVMPRVDSWGGEAKFFVVDELITEEVFHTTLSAAGCFVGLGRFRPRNNGYYGRFTVEGVEWDV